MPTPVAIRYAASSGLLVGAIKNVQPVLARSIDSLGELLRRDPSPMLLAVQNEVAFVSQELTRAIKDAEAVEDAERTRRELQIHAED